MHITLHLDLFELNIVVYGIIQERDNPIRIRRYENGKYLWMNLLCVQILALLLNTLTSIS